MAIADAPLLAQLLGIRPPWTVLAVLPAAGQRLITVQVALQRPAPRFTARKALVLRPGPGVVARRSTLKLHRNASHSALAHRSGHCDVLPEPARL